MLRNGVNGVVGKRVVNGITLVTLGGELDFAVAPALHRDLTAAAEATAPDLAIDLRQVTFLDCAVVGVLLGAHKRVASEGGCLRLVGAQRSTLRLLGLCRLDSVICVHDSVEAATAAVCARPHRRPEPSIPARATPDARRLTAPQGLIGH